MGREIKKFRLKSGLTQVELAGLVSVEPTYISAIENDKKIPSFALLHRLGRVVGFRVKIELLEAK